MPFEHTAQNRAPSMNIIEITYNPFHTRTNFVINDGPPAPGCKLSSYQEVPLHAWIARLFDELSLLFNGDDRFRILFTGLESDYAKLVMVAQSATKRGMEVETSWLPVQDIEERLALLERSVKAAREHSLLERVASGNDILSTALNDLLLDHASTANDAPGVQLRRAVEKLDDAIHHANVVDFMARHASRIDVDLEKIDIELNGLELTRLRGADARADIEKLFARQPSILQGSNHSLEILEAAFRNLIRVTSGRFAGLETADNARAFVNRTEKELRSRFDIWAGSCGTIYNEVLGTIHARLFTEYRRCISDSLLGSAELELPLVGDWSVPSFDLSLEIADSEIETRQVTLKIGREPGFFPRMGGGGARTTHVTEEYVNLADFWKKRETRVHAAFKGLLDHTRTSIESNRGILFHQAIQCMRTQLDSKLDAIRSAIAEKRRQRESIIDARVDLQEFIARLDALKAALVTALQVEAYSHP
jgi:hypothetical protein